MRLLEDWELNVWFPNIYLACISLNTVLTAFTSASSTEFWLFYHITDLTCCSRCCDHKVFGIFLLFSGLSQGILCLCIKPGQKQWSIVIYWVYSVCITASFERIFWVHLLHAHWALILLNCLLLWPYSCLVSQHSMWWFSETGAVYVNQIPSLYVPVGEAILASNVMKKPICLKKFEIVGSKSSLISSMSFHMLYDINSVHMVTSPETLDCYKAEAANCRFRQVPLWQMRNLSHHINYIIPCSMIKFLTIKSQFYKMHN